MTSQYSISICLCTCRRNDLLEQLLSALEAQCRPGVEIIVADNDLAHGAKPLLELWQTRLPLKFVHVPQPNIALARNATVALAGATWIAFIDDDELPTPEWLALLHEAQLSYDADVLMAPVLAVYRPDIPDWLRQGRFFERPRYSTGTIITDKDARTGNALVRAALLKAIPGPFDPLFGRSGGEDSIVFRQLFRQGARFFWCDEAFVSEPVDPARANAAWLLLRAYRFGQTTIQVELYRQSPIRQFARGAYLGGRALLQLLVALGIALLCAPLSRIRSFRWLRTAVAQLGKLSALFGRRYLEYAR